MKDATRMPYLGVAGEGTEIYLIDGESREKIYRLAVVRVEVDSEPMGFPIIKAELIATDFVGKEGNDDRTTD